MTSANAIMMAWKTRCPKSEQSASPSRTIRLGLAMIAIGLGAIAHAGDQHRVSQKGRAFSPTLLEMQAGDSVEFVNDDGDLLHHAYLESDQFSFDTGDQGPGSRTIVAFPTKGSFTVMCGIHPKMKLTVRVR